jgi:hypothetical protein
MEGKLDRNRKRVFVSYVHSEPDQALATHIALVLKRDHEVFIDLDMTPGRVQFRFHRRTRRAAAGPLSDRPPPNANGCSNSRRQLINY